MKRCLSRSLNTVCYFGLVLIAMTGCDNGTSDTVVPLRYNGPQVVSGLPSQVLVSDGTRNGIIAAGEPISIDTIPRILGVLRDASHVDGKRCVLSSASQNILELRAGSELDVVRSWRNMYRFTLEGALIDPTRKRIVTIGSDESPPMGTDEFTGPGSVRMWNFDGTAIGSPYFSNEPPVSISRDWLASTFVVGTKYGWIHVFKTNSQSFESLSDLRLDSGRLDQVAVSFMGSFIAATGSRGAKIWRTGHGVPLITTHFDPHADGGARICFLDDTAEERNAKAVLCLSDHIWSFTLGDDSRTDNDFDLGFEIEDVCRSNREGEVVLLSRKAADSDSAAYSLNVATKAVTRIPWNK